MLSLIFSFLKNFPPKKYSCIIKTQHSGHTTDSLFSLDQEMSKLKNIYIYVDRYIHIGMPVNSQDATIGKSNLMIPSVLC